MILERRRISGGLVDTSEPDGARVTFSGLEDPERLAKTAKWPRYPPVAARPARCPSVPVGGGHANQVPADSHQAMQYLAQMLAGGTQANEPFADYRYTPIRQPIRLRRPPIEPVGAALQHCLILPAAPTLCRVY